MFLPMNKRLNAEVDRNPHRVYQLTWTLPSRAPGETVEYASRTFEDGDRERLWTGCEPKSVSADQMHSTHGTQSPRAHETASSIVCRVR